MLWLKAFHVVFVVTWFAGLFYLPRLFVYHVATADAPGRARFIVMERRLFFMMSLGALLAVLFGIAMISAAPGYLGLGWLRAKLLLVAALVGYHAWCYQLLLALRAGHNTHSQRWFRLFRLPTLLLIAIVVLAVVKP
jgi:putative membrane protein